MNPFFVSICVPAYQADRFLAATLESVRRQTHPHWELIVVEDGSHDRTHEIVTAFNLTVTQPVRYLRHERNRGLPVARNTGIAAARHPWVALLDSDDLWQPHHLASLAARAQAGPVDLVHSGSVLFATDPAQPLGVRAPSPAMLANFPQSLFTGEYIIQPASVLLRRDLWQDVGGFDPAFRYVEDRDMWLRCARAGARFAYSGEDTCLYRRHPAGLSTHAAAMAEAAAAVFDKHLDWTAIPAALRQRRAAETWAAAGRLCQRTDPQRSSRHFRHACAVSWRFEWWLRGVACALFAALPPRWRTAGNNPT